MVCQWSLPNYLIASKTKNFVALLFFLVAYNEKFKRENEQPFAYAANANANEAWWTWDSQARTWLMDCLFFIMCSLENNAFSVLHYVISDALHYSMLHRFEIFSVPGTNAHRLIRLPPCCLASSRGCTLAINEFKTKENKTYLGTGHYLCGGGGGGGDFFVLAWKKKRDPPL